MLWGGAFSLQHLYDFQVLIFITEVFHFPYTNRVRQTTTDLSYLQSGSQGDSQGSRTSPLIDGWWKCSGSERLSRFLKLCFSQLREGRRCDFYLQNQPQNRGFSPLFSPAHLLGAPLPNLLQRRPSPSPETPSEQVLEGSNGNSGCLTNHNDKMSAQMAVDPGSDTQTSINCFSSISFGMFMIYIWGR